ncbi:PREDICTED: UDP-glucose iridoid glucosyltransferase-like [Nicotiana attenuata]|uniref:Udp-glycosyltransferase 76e4 n=1 Tax=Nicotiana attenuata TaxID=49451 RepID=A0A314LAE1_NICAT|nr:PREDICTED: UDP-glucose iridoid glucosyltransferase-like [Nicotiana attenuata]OIT38463.1 udp-glycosyltransferase 76e4 [Nicotiana attenuata]
MVSLKFISLLLALNDNIEVTLQERLAHLQQQSDGIVCIVYDSIMYKVAEVANNLKIPSVILDTSSASLSWTYAAFTRLEAKGYFPLKDSIAEDLVPGLDPLRFKDLPIFKFPHVDDLINLIKTTTDVRTSSAIIWNTTECLEQPILEKIKEHYQIPCFPIGPMHKFVKNINTSCNLLTEDRNCIKWLDNQAANSVLYVSIGSVASISEREVMEIAWGLVNSKLHFLWVIRPDSITGSDWKLVFAENLKRGIDKRGYIVEWAPQKEVLAHSAIGGFWSHCGWNSTLESICEGVPLICRPCFGDQNVNSRYVSHVWRVGIMLENELERDEIERAVRKLMVSEQGEEMRQKAMDFKLKIENSLTENGSSYQCLDDLVKFLLSL